MDDKAQPTDKHPEEGDLRAASNKLIGISRSYVSTLWLVFHNPSALLSSAPESEAEKSPLSPQRFFVFTAILVSAVQLAIGVNAGELELPRSVAALQSSLKYMPDSEDITRAAFLYAVAVLPWIALRLTTRQNVGFQIVTRHYGYISAASALVLSIPILVVMRLLSALSWRFPYNSPVAAVLMILVELYGIWWLTRQLHRETLVSKWKLFIIICLTNVLVGFATDSSRPWMPREALYIPSSGDEPTLRVGDLIIANKWVYHWRRPRRGEIVLFDRPDGTIFVKRVIAVAGDTIQLKHGRVILNEQQLPLFRLGDYTFNYGDYRIVAHKFRESLPNGTSYNIIHLDDESVEGDTPQYTVPPDHVFVIGDNRDNSLDSRQMDVIGFVSLKALHGKAYARIFPVGDSLDSENPEE